ncbi:hypothetical protein [Falsiroseomonas sp. E2-1-a20]|uniref:hypothetical protein n=1 Tax=Falsiroseomonas sp. E2-1-a20 TaxID=3239300 RepID=UPI003F394D9B
MQGVTYVPTDEQRRTVRAMSGLGIPQDDLATFLDIDKKKLRKHFRQELDRGSVEAATKVAQSLFRMATDGGSVAAAIFWMKARAGWREKHDGSGGASGDPADKSIEVLFHIVDPKEPGPPRPIIEPDFDQPISGLPQLDGRERD